MSNKDKNNTNLSEEKQIENIKNILKEVPRVNVPMDFDHKLKRKIVEIKNPKPSNILNKIFFPESGHRALVYSTIMIIIICSIFLIKVIQTNLSQPYNSSDMNIDTLRYQDKKVLVLPPVEPEQNIKTGQDPIHKIIGKPKKEYNEEEIKDYISSPSAPAISAEKSDTDSVSISVSKSIAKPSEKKSGIKQTNKKKNENPRR